jgi:hypothetical protein
VCAVTISMVSIKINYKTRLQVRSLNSALETHLRCGVISKGEIMTLFTGANLSISLRSLDHYRKIKKSGERNQMGNKCVYAGFDNSESK